MVRLRDSRTGVVVDVDDATATALGAAYGPADFKQDQKDEKPKSAPSRRSRKSEQ